MVDRLTTPVTYFNNLTKISPDKVSHLGDLLNIIKDHSIYSDNLKTLYSRNKTEYDKQKRKLPGFVLGELMERKDNACTSYSPCLAFDIDGIDNDSDLKEIFQRTKTLDYVFASFPSVSGHGLRILIFTDSTIERHSEYYNYILSKLKQDLRNDINHKIDNSTKNVSRLWFYAPVNEGEYYENLDAEIISCPIQNDGLTKTGSSEIENISIDKQVDLVFQIIKNRNISGRNNFTMEFTRLASEYGIPIENIASKLMSWVAKDFTEKELRNTINANYSKSTDRYNNAQLRAYSISTIGLDQTNRILNLKKKKVKKTSINNHNESKPKFVKIVEYIESKYELRKNELSLDIEVRKKDDPFYDGLNDNDLSCELMENGFSNIDRMLKTYLSSSKIDSYNPLKDYLNSCPKWAPDKPDYIQQLSSYVVAQNQEWFDIQFKKMLVRSLACSLKVIPFNKQIFTLVGKQNDGKTSFLRFLTPKPLEQYYTENLRLDKDGLISLAQNIYINLDEIATIPYKDRDRIKSLVTSDTIKERMPYASKATKIKRIANFLASTNERELLNDDTGNVRWLIFEIEMINHDEGESKGYNKNIDIDNVYAQAYYLLQNGFKFKLSSEDLKKSESENINFVKSFPEMELIQDIFIPCKEEKAANFRTNSSLLQELSEMVKYKVSPTMIGKALNHLGYKKKSQYSPDQRRSIKGYYIRHKSQPKSNGNDDWSI